MTPRSIPAAATATSATAASSAIATSAAVAATVTTPVGGTAVPVAAGLPEAV